MVLPPLGVEIIKKNNPPMIARQQVSVMDAASHEYPPLSLYVTHNQCRDAGNLPHGQCCFLKGCFSSVHAGWMYWPRNDVIIPKTGILIRNYWPVVCTSTPPRIGLVISGQRT